jgi:hypothetical protein
MSTKSTGDVIGNRPAFFALYKDDRWKAFSKRVRDFYANVCFRCRAANKTTNVHHWKYYPDRAPWEYELGEVAVLCVECHDTAHGHLQDFRRYVFPRLSPPAFRALNGALVAGLTKHDPIVIAYALAEMVATPGAVERFAKAWKPVSK